MKKITAIMLLLLLLFMSSCGKDNVRYRRVESLEPLESKTREILDDSTLVKMSVDDIDFALDLSPDEYEKGFVLLSTSGASIDEVGIFEAKGNEVDSLKDELESYIEDCQEAKEEWLKSYNPSEVEKLQRGRVFRYGNYLLYTFLSEEDTELVRESVRSYLRES